MESKAHLPAASPEVEADLDAVRRRRNVLWLVALLILVGLLFAASRPLFNRFHDPYMSETTISH